MNLIPHSYHYILTRSHPAIETAQAFWATLIPHGLHGGALAHVHSTEDGDDDMSEDGGWTDKYTQWWFDYLNEKGGKGISKDTWIMVKAMFFHAWYGGTKTLNHSFSSLSLSRQLTRNSINMTLKVSRAATQSK